MGASLDDEMSRTILGHRDLDLSPSFWNNHVWSILYRLFEVGIPYLVCVDSSWNGKMVHFGSL